jgi:hypothetical protein
MDAFAAKLNQFVGYDGLHHPHITPFLGSKKPSRRRARHQLKHDLVSEVNEALAYLDEVSFVQSITADDGEADRLEIESGFTITAS